jgi:hypothetical protein
MKKTKSIGWQKYESLLEEQLSSPILSELLSRFTNIDSSIGGDNDDEYDTMEEYEEASDKKSHIMIPMTENMIKDINLLNNFDCWIGHTNFDITKEVRQKLDKISGIEALKIYSRYRFFVGVGKMFDFKNVRKEIETQLTKE